MARKPSAGDLYHRVGFNEPQTGSDGAGGVLDGHAEQFMCRADFIHLRGGETVLAARLQGTHTQVIRVRATSQTRAVTTDWTITDKRTSEDYNIRDIEPSRDRQILDFLCEKGVAA